MAEKSDCYKCGYRASIAGFSHSQCRFAFRDQNVLPPLGHSHGIKHGWWVFPFNFDPVWLVGECRAFSAEADPAKMTDPESSPIAALIAGLASRW